jgi:hypothetical protein
MLALNKLCCDLESMKCAQPILYSLSGSTLKERTGWFLTTWRSELPNTFDFGIRLEHCYVLCCCVAESTAEPSHHLPWHDDEGVVL